MSDAQLDDDTFEALRDYVRDLSGIHFDDKKRYLLESRFRRRASRCDVATGKAYIELLRSDRGAAEREALIAEVTTNETSFFRHGRQMEILKQVLGEQIEARRVAGDRSLSVWSAACSSGEEAYTVAMMLSDLVDDLDRWDIQILGTDISAEQIERARAATYTEREMRSLSDTYHRHVDIDADGGGRMKEAIRELVQFDVANLILDPAQCGYYDFVICRNALIYFDAATRERVLEGLHRALRPGGGLILGPSDSLQGVAARFARTPYSTYNFFKRPDDEIPGSSGPAADAEQVAAAPVSPAPSAPGDHPLFPPAASLQGRMLALRMDHGLQSLGRDLDSSIAKALECVLKVMAQLKSLSEQNDPDASSRATLTRMERQLDRAMFQLQVGDRGQQRVEALRALLQELIDREITPQQDPVDLGVQTSRFDPTILNEEESMGIEGDDRHLSQDEIDALFD
ncbi:MAG: protein-glutamate O-methyltransferase CheR [Gemmatimonadetes bacterium]|nr:protein-glutamate O-methyltransferase CheR [Gemmatimonadota bacterium]MBT5143086.1 protein-glutamate O-methyltransferase CheR [Gemmatimonadota bacterium]MBT5588351.1 protein-glutamate O-methyltransferase CheR [Gemmatimonadota bacterium]MBT5963511.1 protein-glutamate O-methyltransferase CheR [Gemmatimonadota bacterium]MBT7454102.1 protein-glutamate O-methyltransferase CheR [Gemmatimonadota bacterium]